MKKILLYTLLFVSLFLAGCPDGAYLGAMYLKANMGPYGINEVVPMAGFQWDLNKPPQYTTQFAKNICEIFEMSPAEIEYLLSKRDLRSPPTNSAFTKAVSSDRGDLSK